MTGIPEMKRRVCRCDRCASDTLRADYEMPHFIDWLFGSSHGSKVDQLRAAQMLASIYSRHKRGHK